MNPNPGAFEAARVGCRCPGPANQYGRGMAGTSNTGAPLFVVADGCELHGAGSGWAWAAEDVGPVKKARRPKAPPPSMTGPRPIARCGGCGKIKKLIRPSMRCDNCYHRAYSKAGAAEARA